MLSAVEICITIGSSSTSSSSSLEVTWSNIIIIIIITFSLCLLYDFPPSSSIVAYSIGGTGALSLELGMELAAPDVFRN